MPFLAYDCRAFLGVSYSEIGQPSFLWSEFLLVFAGLMQNEESLLRQHLSNDAYRAPVWAQNMLVILGKLAGFDDKTLHKLLPARPRTMARMSKKARAEAGENLLKSYGINID